MSTTPTCSAAVSPTTEAVIAAIIELFPSYSRLRLMRQWGGIVDISPDTSPIIGKTPIENLYISCGWGTGGYKAIPAGGDTLAHTIVNDAPHPLDRIVLPVAVHARRADR